MDFIAQTLLKVELPRIIKIREHFCTTQIEDVASLIRDDVSKLPSYQMICPGQRIAITAGSRGIDRLPLVLRTLVEMIKAKDAEPFLVPAMGSHGGATAEGQVALLSELGITSETIGAPIFSSMEVVQIGNIEDGRPVYIDRYAHEADGIILVNRIKAHTGFRGEYESGLMKMMTIGLGKQKGAYVAHSAGDDNMPERLFKIGSSMIAHAPIILGVGLLENAFDKTYKIAVLKSEEIPEKEPALLDEAKAAMGKIFLDACDVLILEKIGKNYSGGGMDPNVVGRSRLPIGIKSERMGIFGLSEESHGNATGMGRADVGTMNFFHQISFDDTYPNAVTDHDSSVYKIPLIVDNDKECIKTSMAICLNMDPEHPRIIILKNSLEIEDILISEALIPEAKTKEQLTITSEPFELEFDAEGNMLTQI